MKHPWLYLISLITAGTFLWFGFQSLSNDITAYSLWLIVSLAPLVYIPVILIMSLVVIIFLLSDSVSEHVNDMERLKETVFEAKYFGVFHIAYYFLFLMTGCLFVASSYVYFGYGLMFIVYGIVGIMAIELLKRYDEKKDVVIWD